MKQIAFVHSPCIGPSGMCVQFEGLIQAFRRCIENANLGESLRFKRKGRMMSRWQKRITVCIASVRKLPVFVRALWIVP